MVEYSKGRSNRYTTKKTKNCCKNEAGITLRMKFKMFYGNEIPHELLLTTSKKKAKKYI